MKILSNAKVKELKRIINRMDQIMNEHAVLHDGQGGIGSSKCKTGPYNKVIGKLWNEYLNLECERYAILGI